MANVLDGLRAAPMLLAIAYGCYGLYILSKLRKFLKYSGSKLLDTRKLLAASMFFVCVFRCLTFITIALVNRRGYALGFHGSSNPVATVVQEGPQKLRQANLDFFEKSMLVLFDLPDYMIVTTFTLLVLVWAEVFLDSRAHWLSSKTFRRRALIGYLVFNATVYATQLVLYSLLFVPTISTKGLRVLLFCSVAVLNFFVPITFLGVAIYLYCQFAAFPYKGVRSRLALERTTRVVIWWTGGRVLWAMTAVSAGMRDWLTNWSGSSEFYAVVLVAVFGLTELMPFSVALEPDFLPILAIAEGLETSEFTDHLALLPTAHEKERRNTYDERDSLGSNGDDISDRSRSQSGLGSNESVSQLNLSHQDSLEYGTMDMRAVEMHLATPDTKHKTKRSRSPKKKAKEEVEHKGDLNPDFHGFDGV